MKTLKVTLSVLFLAFTLSGMAQNNDDKRIMKDAETAQKTLVETNGNLQTYIDSAAGYVIFPNVGKGGFIIGAASGNGVLYENKVPVGMADLKKLNIGFQAGGQAIIEIIFFENEAALADFKDGEYEFAAEASAVALKSGVSIDAKYKDGVAVFTLPKAGLMADATVGGQKFKFHKF